MESWIEERVESSKVFICGRKRGMEKGETWSDWDIGLEC